MTTLYRPVEVDNLEALNALALDGDKQDNGAYVIFDGALCAWLLPYAVRNEGPGYWSYEDGYGGSSLIDGDKVTVLVPIEAEEETDTLDYVHGEGPSVRRFITPWQEDPR